MSDRAEWRDGRRLRSSAAVVCATALAFGMAACGGDGDVAKNPSALGPSTRVPASSTSGVSDEPAPEDESLCALAAEIAGQEDFPTVDQLTEYKNLAPAEIADAVDVAAPAFIAAGGDAVKFFIALADDDVERAMAEISAWEADNCGIEEDGGPGAPLAAGATREREDGATTVAVVATDHAFRIGSDAIVPGRTSLVLTNDGEEAHFMQLFKLAKGATMEQVMASEDGGGSLIDGSWDSGFAAPGGGRRGSAHARSRSGHLRHGLFRQWVRRQPARRHGDDGGVHCLLTRRRRECRVAATAMRGSAPSLHPDRPHPDVDAYLRRSPGLKKGRGLRHRRPASAAGSGRADRLR